MVLNVCHRILHFAPVGVREGFGANVDYLFPQHVFLGAGQRLLGMPWWANWRPIVGE
jgi:hypothetical protein